MVYVVAPDDSKPCFYVVYGSDQSATDDAASNVPATAQGIVPVQNGPETKGQGEEAWEAFLQMMSIELVRTPKPLVDKIRKQEAEDFRANIDDDPKRVEFWLENSMKVFDELSCTPEESLKCIVSLLRDSAYHWWKTLTLVVPKEKVTWDFFLKEFQKKYISQRFVDQKRKEFLELKQGKMTLAEYEHEFVRLSKYTQKCVSTEAILCKRFEDGLNEDLRLLVGILELKEFVVLVDRASKAKELSKEKRKAVSEPRDARERPMSKSYQAQSKRSKEVNPRMSTSVGYSQREQGNTYSGSRVQATSMASWEIQSPNQSAQVVADITLGSVGETTGIVISVVPPTISSETALKGITRRRNRK
ncbi:maturase K [Gossypium australe]|uniref:Maturase K n=1 Tax=Gossypium australe TaxID=47621 RepID=A0A5B6WI12_9ROSI|nr:maturase K [Gossypium australe]